MYPVWSERDAAGIRSGHSPQECRGERKSTTTWPQQQTRFAIAYLSPSFQRARHGPVRWHQPIVEQAVTAGRGLLTVWKRRAASGVLHTLLLNSYDRPADEAPADLSGGSKPRHFAGIVKSVNGRLAVIIATRLFGQ